MIIMDKREKNSMVYAELVNKKVDVKFDFLEVADYIIGNIGIERKTINDFISSMLNKRLLRQIENLKQFERQLLIIEGFSETRIYSKGKLNDNAIRGMVLSTIFDFQIPVLFTEDEEDTANFLIILDKHLSKPKKEVSLKPKRKVYTVKEQLQFIVESFPGIGPSLAKQLLLKFKTIKRIINASLPELEQVEKLGKKKAKLIKEIIEMKYPN
jgi:Fanconi anemia group M protein